MILIPDDAVDRLFEAARKIGTHCEKMSVPEWEIYATQGYGHSLDIEAGRISMASGGGDGGFGIRIVDEGRYGYAHLVDINSAEQAISQAISIAKKSPSIQGFELPGNLPAESVSGMMDKKILDLGPEDLLEQGDQVISRVTEIDSRAVAVGGGIGVGAGAAVILNSNGIEDGGIHTSHGIGIHVSIDENDDLTSSYEGESSRYMLKDLTSSVDKAVYWSQITRDKIKGGETEDCPVLLTSDGFSPLFSVVVPSAVNGERLAKGESFWSQKQNQLVMANHLSLIDDGLMEGGLSSGSRDGEGVPSRTQTLVDSGKLVGELWSTRDAAKMIAEGKVESVESTGSAVRGGHTSPPSCGCSDLILESSSKTYSRERLAEEMENGYIVHSVMGAHTANPTSGDFSVTTSTILQVKNGEIIGALSQAGFFWEYGKSTLRRGYSW